MCAVNEPIKVKPGSVYRIEYLTDGDVETNLCFGNRLKEEILSIESWGDKVIWVYELETKVVKTVRPEVVIQGIE